MHFIFPEHFVQARRDMDITVCVDVFQPFYGGRTSRTRQAQTLYGYVKTVFMDKNILHYVATKEWRQKSRLWYSYKKLDLAIV